MTANEPELKLIKCPFCGSEPDGPIEENDGSQINSNWMIECGYCPAQIITRYRETTIAAWNRRA